MKHFELMHLGEEGEAELIDVDAREYVLHVGRAEGFITMPVELIERLGAVKSGNAYEIARLAGIMGAKKTPEIIPLCHDLNLDKVSLELTPEVENGRVRVFGEARAHTRAGVALEALTAVNVALLTLYSIVMAPVGTAPVVISDVTILPNASK